MACVRTPRSAGHDDLPGRHHAFELKPHAVHVNQPILADEDGSVVGVVIGAAYDHSMGTNDVYLMATYSTARFEDHVMFEEETRKAELDIGGLTVSAGVKTYFGTSR